MELIIAFFMYVLEIARYLLWLNLCFKVSIKYKLPIFLGGIGYIGVIAMGLNLDAYGILLLFILIIIELLLVLKEGFLNRISWIVMAVFVITGTDGIFDNIREIFFEGWISKEAIRYLFSSFMTFSLIGLLYRIKMKKGINLIEKLQIVLLGKTVYCLIGIMGITILLVNAGLDVASKNIKSVLFHDFYKIVMPIEQLSVVAIGFMIIYVSYVNNKMRETFQLQAKLKEAREKYYELLLQKETDTRKFRHDLNNHFICLREMLKLKEVDEAQEYIEIMYKQIKYLSKKCYATGDKIIDIMLNYYLTDLESIEVRVKGQCLRQIDVSEVDLCSVTGNLIQNAVEEAERASQKERFVEVYVHSNANFFKMEILNNSDKENFKKTKRDTQKTDKVNHGWGLVNVSQIVKKYGGVFEFGVIDHVAKAEILLPIVKE